MILDDILAQTRRTIAAASQAVPYAEIEQAARAASPPRGFARALRSGAGTACIAEFKRRSPSKGWIDRDAVPAAVARAYSAGGAVAMSVLTDGPFFGGSLADLGEAREAAGLPVLRKDFIVDPYQVAEARAAGADAILLIVAALRAGELPPLLGEAARFGMDALVEAHDADEVQTAVAAGAHIVGINHRDLRTFTMDMELAAQLRRLIPADRIVVAESGIKTAADLVRLRAAGIDAVLVGESLMRAADPAAALRSLLGRS